MEGRSTRREISYYCKRVIANKTRHGKLERLAVLRYKSDLKRRDLEMKWDRVDRAVRFIELLKHTEGELSGQRIVLEPWQLFILTNLVGFYYKGGRFRRYNYGYIEVARKNGKSTFLAALGLYFLLMDGEGAAQVYSAATKRDQAKIVFDCAKRFVIKNSKLTKALTIHRDTLSDPKTLSKFEPLPADAKTLDGLNPHFTIVDEYHVHKNDELYNVIKSGMGARANPQLVAITTAGFNKNLPCYSLRKVGVNILEGLAEDDSQFVEIFTIDEEDDWTDPKVWVKANPNMDVSVSKRYLEIEYNQAKNSSTQVVNFMTKNLNVWTDAAAVWINTEIWDKQKEPTELTKNRVCYGGLDLSTSRDLTVFSLVFPEYDTSSGEKQVKGFTIKNEYFIPRYAVENRSYVDGVPYGDWARNGHINVIEGNTIDYNFIKQKMIEAAEKYNVRYIAYDRWNASQLVVDGLEIGLPLEPFGQGWGSMNAPTKEFEKLALEFDMRHGGDPVLKWALGNVVIQMSPSGDIKVVKDKSNEKVDPVVATVMAIGQSLLDEGNTKETKAYKDRGFLMI